MYNDKTERDLAKLATPHQSSAAQQLTRTDNGTEYTEQMEYLNTPLPDFLLPDP
jgi:hypothetical protein